MLNNKDNAIKEFEIVSNKFANAKFNGVRLKAARKYRGMTIKDLAESVGISKQAISQFENMQNYPQFETLMKIVDVLKFPREYFCQRDQVNIELGNTYFRSLSKMTKKEENMQKEKVKLIGKIFNFLDEYIEFPKLNLPEFHIEMTIEEIAMELRKYWGLGEEPVTDMVYLLEKNGIIVTAMNTNTKNIDGFSQQQNINSEKRFIVVLGNDKNSAVRRQFSAAHELGHIILHDGFLDMDDITTEEYRNMENEAHSFAAAFLLPKSAFIKDVSAYPTDLNYYKQLKKKWRTSISAMVVRANHLGVISNGSYQSINKRISKLGWRKQEPLDNTLIISQPTVLRRAIDILLDNDILDEDGIIKELSERNLALFSEEVEVLLGLEKGKLKSKAKRNNVIEMQLKQIKE